MKMSLSVVMGVINNVSAPIKAMASDSDHYAKKIASIKKSQSDDSAALHLIESFGRITKEADKNVLSLNEAKEKLEALQAKEKKAAETGAALTLSLTKQSEALAILKAKATTASGSNDALNKKILKQSSALERLTQKEKAANKPNAALTNQLAKQAEKVAILTHAGKAHNEQLTHVSKGMKQAGVNVNQLDNEFTRLSTRYAAHAKDIDRVSKKYSRLKRAMAPINKLSRALSFPKIGGAALTKGVALLSGLSLGSLYSQINSTASEMDALSKSAQTLKMPIGELQAMQSQAEHAGVGADSLTASMGNFTKRLGVLQTTGSGALGSFLKGGKNPLYRALKNAKDTQDAYEKVLDAFSTLKSNQEQMAFADAVFGGSGRKMLIMLRDGTKGLTAARKEFNETGGGVTEEDAGKAEAYNDALQKVQESIRSIKFAVLTPIMEKLTLKFSEFSDNFKDMDWRNDIINKTTKVINTLYEGIGLLGNGLIFISEHMAEVLAGLALLKIAFVVLNAAIMGGPIGWFAAAIAAVVVAVLYLIDTFIGFDAMLKKMGLTFDYLWEKLKTFINFLPDALVPDWASPIKEAGEEMESLKNKMNDLKDKNIALGITTNDTLNNKTNTTHTGVASQRSPSIIPAQKITPLTTQPTKSLAQVALTIKSDKPVTIDKATSGKGVDLSINLGNMALSY